MDGWHGALIGREPELAAIRGFLAERRSVPEALVIDGPAGVGKTTLWRAGVDMALADGHLVLACRPASAEVHLLYGGLSDLLVEHVENALPHLPAPQRRAIEVVLLLADDDRPADQRALAAGVLGAVRELAAARPLLVAIDDAQWLDASSVLVIEYVLRRLRGVDVTVLASWRTDSLARRPGREAVRQLDLEGALGRPPRRLPVGPLSSGAIHQILRDRTGHAFPRPLLRRIHEASGGNPFFALEIARAMEAREDTWETGEPLALSATLTELLDERFAGLPGRTHAALFLAAATSQPTPELLEAAMGAPARPHLAPAAEAGIVTAVEPQVAFAHPLLRAVAASLPSVDERRDWHRRLAEVAVDPEARARHLALARPGPDAEVAERLHTAARSARSRGAPVEAGELFVDAIHRLPVDDAGSRTAWSLEAAPVLRQAGDPRRARALLEAAVADLPRGHLRSDARLMLSGLVKDDPGGDLAELGLIEAALEDAGGDPARRAAALLGREMWERHRDRFDAALPIAREALDLAEQSGDAALLAGALTRTADLEVLLGLARDPVDHFRRAIAAGEGLQLDASADSAPSMLAACLIRAGRVDEARSLLVAERDRVLAEGDEASLQMVSVFLAELEWLAGNWGQARRHVDEGLLVAEQADARLMEGALSALLALVDASRGRFDVARSTALHAIAVCEEVGDRSYAAYARHVLGFLELAGGDPSAARDQFDAYPMPEGPEGTKRLAFVADHIEALLALGSIDEASSLADTLARRGEQVHRPPLAAAAARSQALVAAARGDLGAALEAAERAVGLTAGLGLPFEHGRALLVLGDTLRRAKQRRAARERLEEARATFERLGAVPWVAHASASIARIGGRVAHDGLTATEAQVATLVARGMTNKEVAAELYVTVRAVEANLSRIYAKLGVRSRTELAHRR